MLRIALALLLAAAAGSAPAQGKVYGYTAELEQAARRAATARARGGNVTAKGCSQLARAVGPVAAYRSEVKSLAAADLRECNRLARGAGAAKAAQAPARPQRATTPEISFTGIAAGAEAAAVERRP
jgi:hypothetical protein